MIHMIALTVVRIIQNKIVSFKVKDTTKNRKMELSGTFNTSFKLLDIFLYTDNMYRFNNIDSGDLKVLLNTFNINIIFES